MQAILDFNLEQLCRYLEKQGFPHFAAACIFSWIYKKSVSDFNRMTDLSLELRDFLSRNFYIAGFTLLKREISRDGTQKFLFALPDKKTIESVLIPTARRLTACISTQVGCKFACGFCASGALGFKRNLTCAEIIEQTVHLKNKISKPLTHLVFMGIGEPLDNYDNVLKAIRVLNSNYSLNIAARRMTISTCGLIPQIQRLANEGLQIELSLSLHAADNQTRNKLMPINKRYPLEKLLEACRAYFKKTKRQLTFEYVLIKGINDGLSQAKRLTQILSGLDAKVNLIPVNPMHNQIQPPSKLEIFSFRDILLKTGIPATVRRPRGRDIQAACGQLRLRNL